MVVAPAAVTPTRVGQPLRAAAGRGQPRDRRPPHPLGVRAARGDAGNVRRCPPQARGAGDALARRGCAWRSRGWIPGTGSSTGSEGRNLLAS